MVAASEFSLLENDPLFPEEIRTAGQKYLEENQITHELKVFPEVPHGKVDPTFSLRYTQGCSRFCHRRRILGSENPKRPETSLSTNAGVAEEPLTTTWKYIGPRCIADGGSCTFRVLSCSLYDTKLVIASLLPFCIARSMAQSKVAYFGIVR